MDPTVAPNEPASLWQARSGGGSLAPFKVTPMVQLGGKEGGGDRPYMGGCCARCTPHSKVRDARTHAHTSQLANV